MSVSLSGHDGIKKRFYVHRLVATAFLREGQPGEQVNHLNFKRADNRIANFEWTSAKGNIRHSMQAGRFPLMGKSALAGEKSPSSKLCLAEVREIRRAVALGKAKAVVARQYGMTKTQISNIVTGKSWKESFEAAGRHSIGAFAFQRVSHG